MFKHVIAPVIAHTATVGIFAIPQTALAQPVVASVAVKFTDLDLTSTNGQQTLERRIVRAARQVCALDDTTTGTRIRSADAVQCYDQALRQVRTRVAAAINARQAGG